MQTSRLLRWGVMALTSAILAMPTLPAFAELKPGDKLDKSNCDEAKGLLPERVRQGYCNGEYGPSEIVALPDAAFQYSQKFTAGSEANAGQYYVTDEGYMYETATKTWPHYWYGFPFPVIDEKDPHAAYKVMYNHQVARFQIDDIYGYVAFRWIKPNGLDRSVEISGTATWFIGRHSGPIENPDDTYLKDLNFGISPYDVVGPANLNWWHTDPEKWQSIWTFVPTIRRVRRVTASNSSEGLYGSPLARDDVYGWGGKIQYMKWNYIGAQDMLVPIAPGGVEKPFVAAEPSPKKVSTDPGMIKDRGQIPLGQIARLTWSEEERVKPGYMVPGAKVHAWWPTNIKLAKRRCWVVEAIPKDPYYAYGRRIVYIDKTAYWAYWSEIYDKAGEYWKTGVFLDTMGHTPGRNMTMRQYVWMMAIDHRQNVAGILGIQSPGYWIEYELGIPNNVHTTQTISAVGK